MEEKPMFELEKKLCMVKDVFLQKETFQLENQTKVCHRLPRRKLPAIWFIRDDSSSYFEGPSSQGSWT